MGNYSAMCENLNLGNLLINQSGNVELTKEALEKASAFSEGNK